MARHSLGACSSSGPSQVIRCRISLSEEQAARAAVEQGETLSTLMRIALAREVESRRQKVSEFGVDSAEDT